SCRHFILRIFCGIPMTNVWCGKTFKWCCEKWAAYKSTRLDNFGLCLLVCLLLALPARSAERSAEMDRPAKHVNLITVDAAINPAIADFIHESITRSTEEGAPALVIQLDTPGGLLIQTKTCEKNLFG